MKALIVSRGVLGITSDMSAGAERVVYMHAVTLQKQGHEIHLVSDVSDDLDIGEVRVHRTKGRQLTKKGAVNSSFVLWILHHLIGNFQVFWIAYRTLRQENPGFDVVSCHGALSAVLLSFVKRSAILCYMEHDASPWIVRYRNPLERIVRKAIYGTINRLAFRRADCIVTPSPFVREDIIERWRIAKNRVAVVSNGVDVGRFNSLYNHKLQCNALEAEPFKDGFVLTVGRLTPRKAVDHLIQAVHGTKMRCVVVGDGPHFAHLKQLTITLGLDQQVLFTGALPNEHLPSVYSRARMMVISSVSENLPLTCLESMACGVPVIATRVGGLGDIIQDGKTGLLVESGNIQQLRDAVLFLWNNPEQAKQLGANAAEFVRQEGTWENVVSQFTQVLQSKLVTPRDSQLSRP